MPDLRTLSIIAILYAVMSLITLAVLWRDKRAARRGNWRTRESTLHLLELLGGWPGTILGQQWLRHKSHKRTYRLVLVMIITMHLSIWAWLLWR
jgi:uncharacterized membrane protein YsdA (DUF1294 family)